MRWRKSTRGLAAILLAIAGASAQQSPDSAERLKTVLERLDRTAADFRSAEATFEWDSYQRVTDETEKQKGKVYFRRAGSGAQMTANVTDPPPAKSVFYTGRKVQLYQPNTDHLDVYEAGKNNAAVESFLVLGFGGSGRDMLKSFDVTYSGTEEVDEVKTDKLTLVPKADKVRGMSKKIELWIDSRGISVQQKFISPEGDYRLNRYSNITLNKKLSDSIFKLKITGSTRVENH